MGVNVCSFCFLVHGDCLPPHRSVSEEMPETDKIWVSSDLETRCGKDSNTCIILWSRSQVQTRIGARLTWAFHLGLRKMFCLAAWSRVFHCLLSCVSLVLVTIYCNKKLLWWELRCTLTYRDKDKDLQEVLSFLTYWVLIKINRSVVQW